MPNEPDEQWQAVSPILTGLRGRCPRCGRGKLFDGFLALGKRCARCGLDFGFIDTGDGPAFFASFLGGFLLLAVAVWMQVRFDPSLWTYTLLFVAGAVCIVGMIRPLKGVLAALQYANKAEPGRFEP